ncbi:MAG: DUF58 domain-containing protein [Anaerolineae bacterium]|nr:DUF58 domain-containing protein [Anaerolineae bacterium]
MFSKAWLQLAIILIVVHLIFDVRAVLVVSAFLLTVVPVARWWSRRSLERVVYERGFSERRAFPGEVLDLTLRLTNGKLLPLGWISTEDRWSMALPLEQGSLFPSPTGQTGTFRSAFAVRGFERITRRYQIRCTRRGFYPFGPVQFSSGDIWGLFTHTTTKDELDWLIVYPQVLPLEALGFPPKEPFGETKATWRILEDPSRAVGIRDHRPEDSFRHIHWKATARRQDLQIKVYEPTTSQNLVIFVNVATFARHWEGTLPLLLEQVIAVAASIASHSVQERYLVGLMANGSIPHSDQPIKVLPSRRPDQLARVLEALAAVSSFTTSSIEKLVLSESPRLPWGSTLIVVTGVVTEELLSALVRLHDVGRRTVLVTLEDEPSIPYTLPSSTLVYHLPAKDLPFDQSLMGEPEEWAAEVAPPLHLAGDRR